MRHLIGIVVASVAITTMIAGCNSGDNGEPTTKSSSSSTTPAPTKPSAVTSPQRTATPTPSPSKSAPKPTGKRILISSLSLPVMEGWKLEEYEAGSEIVLVIDKMRGCNATFSAPDFSCPSFVSVPYDNADMSVVTKRMGACSSSAESALKPIGSDEIAGAKVVRYRFDISECVKGRENANKMVTTGTMWFIKRAGRGVGILAMDGGNHGPKFDVGELAFALRGATWVN